MWDYVFYIAYILQKDKSQHTGLESYINKLFNDGIDSWIPSGNSISLRETLKMIDDDELKRNMYFNS